MRRNYTRAYFEQRFRIFLALKGKNNSDGSFDWNGLIIDALIMAALTFFMALGGLGATGSITEREILAAGIASASEFFLMLAIKRGLREKKK